MRFSLDDIDNFSDDGDDYNDYYEESPKHGTSSPCSSPEPSFNEYSFINPGEEDENVPQLYLPKYEAVHGLSVKQKRVAIEDEALDPELKHLVTILNLRSKMPSVKETRIVPSVKPSVITGGREEMKSISTGNEVGAQSNTSKLLNAMQNCFISKLHELEEGNRKQVKEIASFKMKAEEERKRIEEEQLKRRQEEEQKLRESEAERLRQMKEDQKRQEEALRLKKVEEENARKEQEAEQKVEQERKKLIEQEKLKEESLRSKTVTNFGSIESTFRKYKEKIALIKRDIVEPVKNADPSLKSILSKHKRKVNPKFGQLTNSNQQLEKIQQELCNLVDDTRSNQLAYLWILNFIAKAMVHQAETEVRVKPESGLPLGILALNLIVRYGELQDLLVARCVKKCPFVIGFSTSIATESGRQNMGWKRKSDDKWEEETSYDERMSGIMSFYAIITKLPLPLPVLNSREHPIPIASSWQILARFCNTPLDLLTNTHFVVLGAWWDAAAAEFLQAYGDQGSKLLQLVANDLTLSIADRKYVGAARLQILFEEWQTEGIKSFPPMTP